MSTANPNPMEKSMVSVLVVANAGGGVAVAVWCFYHMSAVNLNPMEKAMVSVLVVANTGGGVAIAMWCYDCSGDKNQDAKPTMPMN
jgi:hypothetical protein